MPLIENFNGSKPRRVPKRTKDDKDVDLLIPFARADSFATPNFLPTSEEEIKILAWDLIHWSEQEESTSLDAFFVKRKMSPSRFIRATATNETLNYAYDIALSNIAVRLEEQVKNNHLYVMNKLKKYSVLEREEARLKREADQEQRVITTYKEEVIGIPVFTRGK